MAYFTLGHRLPYIKRFLFGDRKRFGLVTNKEDPCWKEWEKTYTKFYENTQKKSIGDLVNKAGYRIMRDISLAGKKVLEIGPGYIQHIDHWPDKPLHYTCADINEKFLEASRDILSKNDIKHDTMLIAQDQPHILPLPDNSVDVIVTFYSLEHLHPFENFLDEYKRVLSKEGIIIGAIPAEGGLGWGLGRFLTSRRWLKNNTTINPDKIICWEHPNFASHILQNLDIHFTRKKISFWPFYIPLPDFNLIIKFIYQHDSISK